MNYQPSQIYREMALRKQAMNDLVAFSSVITVPGKPFDEEDEDCGTFYPIDLPIATHHRLIMTKAQECIDKHQGRLMLFLPPGSAKSTYASVVLPAFAMGRQPGFNVISASYGSTLARKMGRKTRSVVKQDLFTDLFGCEMSQESSAADEWALTNGSEYMSGGILSGLTGNRARLVITDDPVKGRAEADSETIQERTYEAFNDDLMSRLIPGGSSIIIQTRWNENDLAGMILPENYNGESGMIECRDGETWDVVCIPAKAERHDDILGRKPGEYIWPEWFTLDHWTRFEKNPRTWASLYQQRPAPDEGSFFKREWFKYYDKRPANLRIYASSDYAVTDDDGDFTVHLVVGVDEQENIYVLDLWRDQTESDKWVDAMISLVRQWKPSLWAEEQGQILKSVGPFLIKQMRRERVFCRREQFVSSTDKVIRCRSIQARASMGTIYLPNDAPWLEVMLSELLVFPAGRNDDIVDTFSLLGRCLDKMYPATAPKEVVKSNRNSYKSARSSTGSDDWRL